ncbi:MAG: hypothetical protein AMS16_05655 [Planctomycetes bacterium DG_58]|nr:MAG: hypothetical protein AMS16_05655 [Planctomycetes bacterium DG_58]
MKAEEVQDVAGVCKMLGEPTRVQIVALVAKRAKSVGALCKALNLAQPKASHHLGLLWRTRLLRRQRKGKKMFYSLNREKLTPVKKFLAKL